jgi:hypothetical protein
VFLVCCGFTIACSATDDASSQPDAAADHSAGGAGGSTIDASASDSGDPSSQGGSGGGSTPAPAVNVLTQHNDIARTGLNLQEKMLKVANVATPAFGKLFERAVDDEIYAQPLIVTHLDIPGKGTHDVVLTATVNDTVYAFDADDPGASDPLWSTSLLMGARAPRNSDMTGACGGNYSDFSGKIGIVSTPVIDEATGIIYVVARTMEGDNAVQRLHALDIHDGHARHEPTVIDAQVEGSGKPQSGGNVIFDALHENQRASLLLLNGMVYIGWSGHCDWPDYHGWLIGYDAADLTQKVVYNTTPDGAEGGIWQSGQGPSSDGTDIFVVTGNGTVGTNDETRNRGQNFLRLRVNLEASTLDVASWFAPYDFEFLQMYDLDLGSAGLLLIPGTQLAVSGGKGGWMYVVNRHDMGAVSNGDSNVLQSFKVNAPYHLHGSPVFWRGPTKAFLYVWAEEDYLRAYPFLGETTAPGSKVFDDDNVLKSTVRAPVLNDQENLPDNKKDMPGGFLSVSSDGNADGTGILWASIPFSGDANQAVQPGVLRAFDATDITRPELWNSKNDPADDCGNYGKFSAPTVANGKVYLASFSNHLCVYGLR